jgi:uncharacterized membrane protein
MAGALIGFGMASLFDGVVVRDLTQWHALTSVRAYGLIAWALAATGIARLWRAGNTRFIAWSPQAFYGTIISAWGLFQVLDSATGYYLGILPDRGGAAFGATVWDLLYLMAGIALACAGYAIARTSRGSADLRSAH